MPPYEIKYDAHDSMILLFGFCVFPKMLKIVNATFFQHYEKMHDYLNDISWGVCMSIIVQNQGISSLWVCGVQILDFAQKNKIK